MPTKVMKEGRITIPKWVRDHLGMNLAPRSHSGWPPMAASSLNGWMAHDRRAASPNWWVSQVALTRGEDP